MTGGIITEIVQLGTLKEIHWRQMGTAPNTSCFETEIRPLEPLHLGPHLHLRHQSLLGGHASVVTAVTGKTTLCM